VQVYLEEEAKPVHQFRYPSLSRCLSSQSCYRFIGLTLYTKYLKLMIYNLKTKIQLINGRLQFEFELGHFRVCNVMADADNVHVNSNS
jgi:hypothetical protein